MTSLVDWEWLRSEYADDPADICPSCGACGGGHHIQTCPDVGALLFAPEGTNLRGLAACLAASRAR